MSKIKLEEVEDDLVPVKIMWSKKYGCPVLRRYYMTTQELLERIRKAVKTSPSYISQDDFLAFLDKLEEELE